MQVVFVHGVNTRDGAEYDKTVSCRRDRFKRLVFGNGATIQFPYWGKHGLPITSLRSMPVSKAAVQALGVGSAPMGITGASETSVVAFAKSDFPAMVASLSVAALKEAALHKTEVDRHKVEDFWMTAVRYAEDRPVPGWLSSVRTQKDLNDRIAAEVGAVRNLRTLGSGGLPKFDPAAFIAGKARDIASPYLSQFLGDAMMFFSRRDQSTLVRNEISAAIVSAARTAVENECPLVLIGHSMGGSVLHELLTDQASVAHFERELGRPLKVDLLLTVGTQVGLFAELKQFTVIDSGTPLAVQISHYWNIFDYTDTLAFVSSQTIPGVIDFEISTAAGLTDAHNAYFDNALFYSRLQDRLKAVGLLP